jgi:hypothetical protein
VAGWLAGYRTGNSGRESNHVHGHLTVISPPDLLLSFPFCFDPIRSITKSKGGSVDARTLVAHVLAAGAVVGMIIIISFCFCRPIIFLHFLLE